jgi:Arc/MetJ-type ribon-helix-helix transcriptional regulator
MSTRRGAGAGEIEGRNRGGTTSGSSVESDHRRELSTPRVRLTRIEGVLPWKYYVLHLEELMAETRRLVTISLPPPLLEQAERVAEEENRSKSELVREALRFYIETREVRRLAARERLFELIDRIQARTRGVPASRIRKLVREALAASRRGKQRSTA